MDCKQKQQELKAHRHSPRLLAKAIEHSVGGSIGKTEPVTEVVDFYMPKTKKPCKLKFGADANQVCKGVSISELLTLLVKNELLKNNVTDKKTLEYGGYTLPFVKCEVGKYYATLELGFLVTTQTEIDLLTSPITNIPCIRTLTTSIEKKL